MKYNEYLKKAEEFATKANSCANQADQVFVEYGKVYGLRAISYSNLASFYLSLAQEVSKTKTGSNDSEYYDKT